MAVSYWKLSCCCGHNRETHSATGRGRCHASYEGNVCGCVNFHEPYLEADGTLHDACCARLSERQKKMNI